MTGWEPTVGLHDDVPEDVYHSHAGSLSVSGAKTLLRSPAKFDHQRQHPVRKAVFDFGHAAHSRVLGVGAELVTFEGADAAKPKATKAWKEQDAEVRAAGGVLLTQAEHDQVCAMADRLDTHRLASSLLAAGTPEVSAYAVDEPTGVLRRGRFDWWSPPLLVDYKTTISADPLNLTGLYGAAAKWGYDMQAAWYTDLARDLGHDVDVFAFIFQEKEAPYEVTVAYIDDADLTEARERIRAAIDLFKACADSQHWRGYVDDDRIVRLNLTQQTYTEETA